MATLTRQKASERMVVLLRPKEKRRLERLARKEKVSSAEIVRRSLDAYLVSSPETESELLEQINVVLDRMLETLKRTHEHLDAGNRERERLRADPEHKKRLAQIDDFIARHQPAAQTPKKRTRVA